MTPTFVFVHGSNSNVRLTSDRSIPLEPQDRFIEEADALTPDNPFDVHSLESSHVGFLVRPRRAATVLTGPTHQR